MNLLIWNCLGLGNPRKFRCCKIWCGWKIPLWCSFVKPRVLLTRYNSSKSNLDSMRCSVSMLRLIWRSLFTLERGVQYPCPLLLLSHIDAKIGGIGFPNHWKFTGFYGSPNQANKSQSWNLMCQISSPSSILWVVGRDFNELLHLGEKMGGVASPIN